VHDKTVPSFTQFSNGNDCDGSPSSMLYLSFVRYSYVVGYILLCFCACESVLPDQVTLFQLVL
jgi:hypothetical protein